MKSFERKSFPRMAKDFVKMNEKGTLRFDNAVQRSFVWKNTTKDNRMSMLIDSMLRGFPIPPMYCNQILDETNNKVYDFLDGKQRTTTILKFLNDEFELVGIPTFEIETDNGMEEIDLNGKKFSELPDDFQDIFKTYSLTVYYYENMDDDSVDDMFARLNNGKSLTAIELTRSKARSFEVVKEIASHKLFKEALSDKAIMSYANEDIVIKSYIQLFVLSKGLDTKDVRPVMETADISDEQKMVLEQIFDKIIAVHDIIASKGDKVSAKIAKRIYTKTHMVAIVPLIEAALRDKKTDVEIASWLNVFFNGGKGASISDKYNNTCSGGANHEASVATRTSELINHYTHFDFLTESQRLTEEIQKEEKVKAEVEAEVEESIEALLKLIHKDTEESSNETEDIDTTVDASNDSNATDSASTNDTDLNKDLKENEPTIIQMETGEAVNE